MVIIVIHVNPIRSAAILCGAGYNGWEQSISGKREKSHAEARGRGGYFAHSLRHFRGRFFVFGALRVSASPRDTLLYPAKGSPHVCWSLPQSEISHAHRLQLYELTTTASQRVHNPPAARSRCSQQRGHLGFADLRTLIIGEPVVTLDTPRKRLSVCTSLTSCGSSTSTSTSDPTSPALRSGSTAVFDLVANLAPTLQILSAASHSQRATGQARCFQYALLGIVDALRFFGRET